MEYVFVYGSLKQGLWNHPVLQKSPLIGIGAVHNSFEDNRKYRMVDLGAFPGVVNDSNDPNGQIHGEVYSVNNQVFKDLDHLESNGKMYQREKTTVRLEDGSTVLAWIYIYLYPTDNYHRTVADGKWKQPKRFVFSS